MNLVWKEGPANQIVFRIGGKEQDAEKIPPQNILFEKVFVGTCVEYVRMKIVSII